MGAFFVVISLGLVTIQGVPLLLSRYVIREVLQWYAAGFALFMILQMVDALTTTVSYMLSYHVGLGGAVEIFGALIPSFLNRGLVLSVPFAVLLAFGRLQGNNEIKAMFAAGVRPLSLVLPLILPFAVVGAVAYWNADYAAPEGMGRYQSIWRKYMGYSDQPPLSQTNYTYASQGRLFHAGQVYAQAGSPVAQLNGVLVQQGDKTMTVSSGQWDTARKVWILPQPWVSQLGRDPYQEQQVLELPQNDSLKPPQRPNDEVSSAKLRARLAAGGQSPEERRADQMELQRRFADPFTPISFALAAGALGLLLRNRAAGFAATVVMTGGFYVLWAMAPELAKVGAVSPVLAAWFPNLVFLAVASALLWRLR